MSVKWNWEASALASIYYLAVYMLGFGFSLGLQVMIARRNGERRYAGTGRTFFQGLFFLSALAVLLKLLFLFLFTIYPEVFHSLA